MEENFMDKLKNNPQIAELLNILEKNGLEKEKNDVLSLAEYIDSMENKLSSMLSELTEMRGEVKQIHDGTLRAKCTHMIEKTIEKVKLAANTVKNAKEKFVSNVGRAIREFKEKGKESLSKAIEFMKIPQTIKGLQECFASISRSMNRNAERTETFRSELGEAGVHMKKAGRILLGLSSKETKRKDKDKGILAKIRNGFKKMSERFSEMEKSANKLSDKLQNSKSSVKAELDSFKQQIAPDKPTPEKDRSR